MRDEDYFKMYLTLYVNAELHKVDRESEVKVFAWGTNNSLINLKDSEWFICYP